MPASDASDVADAVIAAEKAFPTWSAWTREKRRDAMLRLADALEAAQMAFGTSIVMQHA